MANVSISSQDLGEILCLKPNKINALNFQITVKISKMKQKGTKVPETFPNGLKTQPISSTFFFQFELT